MILYFRLPYFHVSIFMFLFNLDNSCVIILEMIKSKFIVRYPGPKVTKCQYEWPKTYRHNFSPWNIRPCFIEWPNHITNKGLLHPWLNNRWTHNVKDPRLYNIINWNLVMFAEWKWPGETLFIANYSLWPAYHSQALAQASIRKSACDKWNHLKSQKRTRAD